MDALRAWYNSEEYRAIRPIREKAMSTNLFAVQGEPALVTSG